MPILKLTFSAECPNTQAAHKLAQAMVGVSKVVAEHGEIEYVVEAERTADGKILMPVSA